MRGCDFLLDMLPSLRRCLLVLLRGPPSLLKVIRELLLPSLVQLQLLILLLKPLLKLCYGGLQVSHLLFSLLPLFLLVFGESLLWSSGRLDRAFRCQVEVHRTLSSLLRCDRCVEDIGMPIRNIW